MTPPAAPGTLRSQLLTRLWAPLLVIMLVSAGLSLAAARHPPPRKSTISGSTIQPWRWRSRSRMGSNGPTVALPPSAVEILKSDRIDRVFYDVKVGDLSEIR